MTTEGAREQAAGRNRESPKERVDRELIELLNGLRVLLPGVQVLLAFLLTVAFSSGFEKTTSTDHVVYFVTVLLTVAATGALTMPAAYHRSGSVVGQGADAPSVEPLRDRRARASRSRWRAWSS